MRTRSAVSANLQMHSANVWDVVNSTRGVLFELYEKLPRFQRDAAVEVDRAAR